VILYNDNDNYCCKVLRTRINDGQLPAGVVDPRPIQDLEPDFLRAFRQIHLFAGIGGFPLGLKWAGVPFDWSIITGGFPCQDISIAGKGAGIDGDRSGLWSEMLRCIRVARPRIVVVENVAALLVRGLDRVVRQLAEIGYDCEWHCIPAAYVGAPHRRDRVWIVGHAIGSGAWHQSGSPSGQGRQPAGALEPTTVRQAHGPTGAGWADAAGADGEDDVAYSRFFAEGAYIERPCDRPLQSYSPQVRSGEGDRPPDLSDDVADADSTGLEKRQGGNAGGTRQDNRTQPGRNHWWATEPNVGRVAYGVSHRVDRLKGLGNAIVPQVAQYIGRHLLERWRGAD
jgi:DNA (cytosine-5)-methyltransferase 1